MTTRSVVSAPRHARRRGLRGLHGLVAAVGALALLASACGSSGTKSTSTPAAGGHHSGKVAVLYAGSLVSLMQTQVGPAFDKATGYTLIGFAGGSKDLATEIKGKVHQGDVFVSASPQVDATLEGSANGRWVKWYATFGSSKLVLGYNPKSKFAKDLKTQPWYDVVTKPGFLLGKTDPATDPKGVLAQKALDKLATAKGLPALETLGSESSDNYPEETLVGRLQAGQLDAGFFYAVEADAAKFPSVPLTGTDYKGEYTITILSQAPNQAGAEAFVNYLLSGPGKAFLTADGLDLVSPAKVHGSGVPAGVRGVISGS